MNPDLIAEAFRAAASNSDDFDALPCVNSLTGAPAVATSYPRAVFSAKFTPMAGSAQVGRAEISIAVESHAGDAAAFSSAQQDHSARVNVAKNFFFGSGDSQDAKNAVVAAIEEAGAISVDPRYIARPAEDQVQHPILRTTLRILAGVSVPQV